MLHGNVLLSLCCLLLQLAMRCEAERLACASFGVTLLHCIGRVYSRQADIFLGGLLGERRCYWMLCTSTAKFTASFSELAVHTQQYAVLPVRCWCVGEHN
jgi:hypothetical protein